MKLKRSFVMAMAGSALMVSAQSGIQNPITQAVLKVYEEELQANPKDYNILLNRADEYYRHGEYFRALPDVDKAIEYAPSTESEVLLRAYILRGGIYNQTKRPQKALPDLEKAVELAPDSYSALYQLANTQYTLGDYRKARISFQRLERLNNRMPEAYIGLARVAVKENNLGVANEMLARAVNLDPNNAETYVRRASVRRQIGDHNGAVDDLILALSIDNKNDRAMNELLDYGNTNYPAAMAGLSNAIAQAPRAGMFRYIRAVVAHAHFHYLAAIEDYQTILDEKLYDYHGIYASIAECRFCLGDYEKALSNIDYALGMIRNNSDHFVLRSKILRALNRNDDAVAAAAAALAIDRQNNEALAEMALAYTAIGNHEEASNLLGEAMLNDAENPKYPMIRAWLFKNFLKKGTSAEQLYRHVAEMEHFFIDNPKSLKGFALLFLGEKEQADRWMYNIINNVTDYDGLIHYYGACYYAQAGNMDKALECTSKALELGYANYHNWTEAIDGGVNVGELRDDLRFLNLLSRYQSIFGK